MWGFRRNWSLTQRPGAVIAIHSGLLMTARIRDDRGDSCAGATIEAGEPLWPMTATWAGEALQRIRSRITYRLIGSPANKITGAQMMISGHRTRKMTMWMTGPGSLITPW